jgi:branched-chain amino acid transport system permease protein
VSIVLTYRLVGVVNFSQSVVGVFGTYVCLSLMDTGVPIWIAVVAGIAAGAAVSAAIGFGMIRWFSEASLETRSSVTIAIMGAVLAVGFHLFGDEPRMLPKILPDVSFYAGGVYFSLMTLASLLFAVLISGVLVVILRTTRIGVFFRAMSDRPTTAELIGIPVGRLSLLVWAVSGAVATVAIILVAPNQASNFLALTMLLLPGLAAALFGLFKNVIAALVGGLILGTVQGAAAYFDAVAAYRDALPFVVILVVLVWSQRKEVWNESH